MKLKKRLKNFKLLLVNHPWLNYIILFFISFLFFTIILANPTFADPDSFYHAKIATLIKDQGIVFDFPYLQFTTLKNDFADHHFLYHLLLVPFIIFLDPLLGLKLATIFFSTLAIVIFYWLLKKFKIKGAWIYTLILLVTNPFIFRLNLAKAQALVLIAIFLAIYLICQRKYWYLFLLSFFFVWLYGGWPLMLVVTVFYIIASYLPGIKLKTKDKKQKICRLFISWYHKSNTRKLTVQNIKLLFAVSTGLLTGLIINPYFSKNLHFYWQQIVQIAVINYQKLIGVGGEWYPYNFFELVASSSIAFILLITGLTLFVLYFKKQTTLSWTFLLLSAFFLILTLKSRRNVEYLIPVIIIFSALNINLFLSAAEFKVFFKDFKKFISQKEIVLLGFIIPIILLSHVVYRDIKSVFQDHQHGFSFNQFKQSSEWLKNNSQPGQIVFHSDWDEFPLLFYHNHSNYYLVGLDPTFMYNYNKDLYRQWHNITIGQETQNLYPIIKNEFGADFVFVDLESHQLLDRNLGNNFYFEKVYEDFEAVIYRVN